MIFFKSIFILSLLIFKPLYIIYLALLLYPLYKLQSVLDTKTCDTIDTYYHDFVLLCYNDYMLRYFAITLCLLEKMIMFIYEKVYLCYLIMEKYDKRIMGYIYIRSLFLIKHVVLLYFKFKSKPSKKPPMLPKLSKPSMLPKQPKQPKPPKHKPKKVNILKMIKDDILNNSDISDSSDNEFVKIKDIPQ